MKIRKNPVLGTWEMAEGEARDGAVSNRSGIVCNPLKILIVDDDEPVRRTFVRFINHSFPGHETETATNGIEGIAAFKANHHCVIIMDLAMPKMDGLTAFSEIEKYCIEQKWQMPPVIFCTGYDPPNTVRNIVAGSMDHCMLRKPIGAAVFAEAIRSRLPEILTS